MAINTWLTPNFVALCHTVRKDELIDFTKGIALNIDKGFILFLI
jgi:hypothetical protein